MNIEDKYIDLKKEVDYLCKKHNNNYYALKASHYDVYDVPSKRYCEKMILKLKKDIFEIILKKYKLPKEEVLIVGDDIKSEIQAGKELEIDTVLYDRLDKYTKADHLNRIENFTQLESFL